METLKIKNRWNDVKKKILDVYPRLTENDLQFREGREEQLLTTLQQKTGKKREELVTWLNQLGEESGLGSAGSSGGGGSKSGSNKTTGYSGDDPKRGGL